MKIVSKMVTNAETGQMRCETLIQTELGSYYISEEDLSTGEVTSRRITANEAREYREFAIGSAAPTAADS